MGFIQIRRASFRGLVEALVQRVRGDAMENDAKENVERFQDYGFAANPVDGQGLKIDWQGHTIVLRMDRLAERPRVDAYEVRVWHKEGHYVALKAGRLVECECDRFVLKASQSVEIETQTMTVKASTKVREESPLHEMTGLTQTQELTIGLTGPGVATMTGGTINYQNVNLNYAECTTRYTGGTLRFNDKDLSDTHTHDDVERGNQKSGTVS
ncbi:phage baseplate assembly protein domain-containing protein [Variovorax sp. DAIF25]|uniref:phage baseplate assembly protein domain-containing protein n=1 Tax=Variovorax sp. DAIF25 TaxID=3080983 RepID=UPI003D6A1136